MSLGERERERAQRDRAYGKNTNGPHSLHLLLHGRGKDSLLFSLWDSTSPGKATYIYAISYGILGGWAFCSLSYICVLCGVLARLTDIDLDLDLDIPRVDL